MICKSSLITQHTIFVFLYFIIPDEKCLIFTRFIEIVYVWDVIVMVAAVIYVRVYQCSECVLRNESLLRSIDCTEDLRPRCLVWFWIQLNMATFLIFTGVSLIQFFTDQFLQLTITILAIKCTLTSVIFIKQSVVYSCLLIWNNRGILTFLDKQLLLLLQILLLHFLILLC